MQEHSFLMFGVGGNLVVAIIQFGLTVGQAGIALTGVGRLVETLVWEIRYDIWEATGLKAGSGLMSWLSIVTKPALT
jgi:hypothetical protein